MEYISILVFIICVIVNFFLSGYETGFVSANLYRIRYLAEKEANLNAKRLSTHYENPARLITTLLVGANLTLVVGTTALTRSLGAGLATIITLPIFVFFSEILPKSVFRHFSTRLVLGLFPMIRFFEGLLAPVTIPVAWVSQRFLNLLDDEGRGMRMFISSSDDMRVLVDESHDQGTLDPDEHEMIHSVMDLQTRNAQEIMVPRIHIQALPETTTRRELTALFIESGRTRLPIYAQSVDHIIGVVNAFDVIKDSQPEREDIQRFIKPILHVPDTMKLDDALKAMRDARQSMAIVADEHGGTDGLITVEDILEEIFGEIHDEYDVMTTQIKKIGPRAFVVDAQMELDEVAEVIGAPIEDAEVDTIGGWINHLAGRIPLKGEVITQGPFRITVLDGTPSHVSSVRLELITVETKTNEEAIPEKEAERPA